ncbi:MAG: ATP-grasp fold amidoligase family protein [Rhodobacteraceae bacterium]|nr:ATP-grasp fold amidoligase family protein [Paracoccaceae bacterium]
MFAPLPAPPTPECQSFIKRVEQRKQQARRKALLLPRTKRQAYIYDHTFENEIEAVAYPLAKAIGRVPNFAAPALYAEKLRSLYLTHPNPLLSLVSDKVTLPRYCAYLDTPIRPPEQIAAYDDPSALDLTTLPESAMLKVSDGCKMNILHGPGMPVTPVSYRFFLYKYWHIDHWRRHSELHYRDIPRRLLVEDALLPVEGIRETGVFCAFGKPYIAITKGRYTSTNFGASIHGILALEDRLKPLESYLHMRPPPFDEAFPKPFRDAMFETTRRVAAPLPHCRVDFMMLRDRCVLGEITISPVALCDYYHDPAQQKLESDLYDFSKLPDTLKKAREIATALDWPTEPSFGHYAPDDPRLATGGQ